MKKWLFGIVLLAAPAFGQNSAVNGWCEQGQTQAAVSGLLSTNYQQGILPSCTVTPYLTGTQTLATYYLTPNGSPYTGPLTANINGQYLFYAATGVGLDLVRSSGTTMTDVIPGGNASSNPAGSTTQIQYNNGNTFAANGNFTTDGNGNVNLTSNLSVGSSSIDPLLTPFHATKNGGRVYIAHLGDSIDAGAAGLAFDSRYGYAFVADDELKKAYGDGGTAHMLNGGTSIGCTFATNQTQWAIASISRSGGVVTITTTLSSGLPSVGPIEVSNVTDTSFTGFFTSTSVSGTTITYNQAGGNGSSSGGTVQSTANAYTGDATIGPTQAGAVHASMAYSFSPATNTCSDVADSIDIIYATNTLASCTTSPCTTGAGFTVTDNGTLLGTYGATTTASPTWAIQHIALTDVSGEPEWHSIVIGYPSTGIAEVWSVIFNKGTSGVVSINPSIGGTTTEQYNNGYAKNGWMTLLTSPGIAEYEAGVNSYSFGVGLSTDLANMTTPFNYITGTVGWPILAVDVENIANGTIPIAGATQAQYQAQKKALVANYTTAAYISVADRWGTFAQSYAAGNMINAGLGGNWYNGMGATCTATVSGGTISACSCSGGTGFNSGYTPKLTLIPPVAGVTLTPTVTGSALSACTVTGSTTGLVTAPFVVVGDGVHPNIYGASDFGKFVAKRLIDQPIGYGPGKSTSLDQTKAVMTLESQANILGQNYGKSPSQLQLIQTYNAGRTGIDFLPGPTRPGFTAYPARWKAEACATTDAVYGVPDCPGGFQISDIAKSTPVQALLLDACDYASTGSAVASTTPSGVVTTPCAFGNFSINQPQTGSGQITVTASGTSVVGDAYTTFTNTFKVGSPIAANSENHVVATITDDQHMTTDAWTSAYTGGYQVTGAQTGKKLFGVFGNGSVGLNVLQNGQTTTPRATLDLNVGNPSSGTIHAVSYYGVPTGVQAGVDITNNTVTYYSGGASGVMRWGQSNSNTITYQMILDASGHVGINVTSPTSFLDVNGAVGSAISTKTTTYSAAITDSTILCDATGGAFTVTLPQGSTVARRKYCVKKIDSSVNACTVAAASGNIDGGTVTLSTQYKYSCMQSDGTNYWVIGNN